MNDYKALRTFLLAAEKRNFAQVARELDMTPAAVTRAIAALEAELGVQLFVRTTRQVSLTTDGAIFAAQIQPAVKTLEDARREVMNAHKSDEGRLRISAPTWFGKTVLPPILSGFKERYPKMSFEISLSDGLVNIVDDDYVLPSASRRNRPTSSRSGARFERYRASSWQRRAAVSPRCSIRTSCTRMTALPIVVKAVARTGFCLMAARA